MPERQIILLVGAQLPINTNTFLKLLIMSHKIPDQCFLFCGNTLKSIFHLLSRDLPFVLQDFLVMALIDTLILSKVRFSSVASLLFPFARPEGVSHRDKGTFILALNCTIVLPTVIRPITGHFPSSFASFFLR